MHGKAEFRSKVPAPVRFLADWVTIPRNMDALRTLKSIETGVCVPYSRLPRRHELVIIGVVLLVLFVVFKILAAIARALCCRGGSSKAQSSISSPKKSKKD